MKLRNPFKKNKQLRELQALSASFAILDEFARRGILHYHRSKPDGVTTPSSGSLLIEESLATLKLAEGEHGFKHFLEQVAQWQNFKLLQEAYEAHRIDTEAKAVREAKKQCTGSLLSESDITRIRQNARENMPPLFDESDVPARHSVTLAQARTPSLSLIQEFDLFIIRATAPSSAQATEANGQLLALGHYDGKTLEMAMYDDIKHNLRKEQD